MDETIIARTIAFWMLPIARVVMASRDSRGSAARDCSRRRRRGVVELRERVSIDTSQTSDRLGRFILEWVFQEVWTCVRRRDPAISRRAVHVLVRHLGERRVHADATIYFT